MFPENKPDLAQLVLGSTFEGQHIIISHTCGLLENTEISPWCKNSPFSKIFQSIKKQHQNQQQQTTNYHINALLRKWLGLSLGNDLRWVFEGMELSLCVWDGKGEINSALVADAEKTA